MLSNVPKQNEQRITRPFCADCWPSFDYLLTSGHKRTYFPQLVYSFRNKVDTSCYLAELTVELARRLVAEIETTFLDVSEMFRILWDNRECVIGWCFPPSGRNLNCAAHVSNFDIKRHLTVEIWNAQRDFRNSRTALSSGRKRTIPEVNICPLSFGVIYLDVGVKDWRWWDTQWRAFYLTVIEFERVEIETSGGVATSIAISPTLI